MTTAPVTTEPERDAEVRPPRLGPAGWVRWAWRTLTSMRTALVLLALLALAAVPGSFLPQLGVASDPGAVVRFRTDHPTLSPWLDRLWLFEVYSAPWFAAIYLLLLVSMTGCVLPRCARLWRSVRADPPRAPSDLPRLPEHRRYETDLPAEEALAAAAAELRRRRFRVLVDGDTIRAEKGYSRELGNLTFHLSLLVLLAGVAAGRLYGFEGTVVVVEGGGFSNARSQYDSFTAGPLFDERDLAPFSFTLIDFDARFEQSGPQRGAPRGFRAELQVRAGEGTDLSVRPARVEVNAPLEVSGTKVFLTGNGYAPRFTVRGGDGSQVFNGPVVFLPRDGSLTSDGVVKAPDAQPDQLGFEGTFLPTAVLGPQGPASVFPDAVNPRVVLTAWTGDLGMGSGAPQSVYELDKSRLTLVTDGARPLVQALRPGDTMNLPGRRGSITFDGVSRFANFQIARDPGKEISLVAGALLLLGLTASLTVRRRRIWLRAPATGPGSPTAIEAATLPLTRRGGPAGELERLVNTLAALPTRRSATPEQEPSR